MLVNNAEDLEIVAVIDWEWSYAGLIEMMWCAPRWLLIQSSDTWEDGSILHRHNRYLEIYIQQVKEQEWELLGSCCTTAELPSTFIQRSKENGLAWFYQIARDSFNSPSTVPFQQLRFHIPDLNRIMDETPPEEVESFVRMKLDHLKQYNDLLQIKREWRQWISDGDEDLPDLDRILGAPEGHE